MVRFKNRWLLIEFIPCEESSRKPRTIVPKQIWAELRDSVIRNFGDAGWGAVGSSLNVKYYSPTTNICIVRVARDHFRIAWAAVTLLTMLNGESCIPQVVHCSGTIKQAQIAAIKFDRELVARMREHRAPDASPDVFDEYLQRSVAEIEALQD